MKSHTIGYGGPEVWLGPWGPTKSKIGPDLKVTMFFYYIIDLPTNDFNIILIFMNNTGKTILQYFIFCIIT